MPREIKHILKILLLGDGAVGKTSLIRRYIDNTFQDEYQMSLGVDFLTKSIKFVDENNTIRNVKLQIWDIAGQSRHVSYSHLYLKGAKGAFYVFDLTRGDTLISLQERWQSQVIRVSPQCLSLVIGNKSDLNMDSKINVNKVHKITQAMHAIKYIKTSAKTGENVNKAFQFIAATILNIKPKKTI